MAEVRYELAGLSGVLRSDEAPLMRYAERHLKPLRSIGSAGLPVVDATLRWHETPPPRDRQGANPSLNEMARLDRDLYVAPGRVNWFRIDDFRNLHLQAEWDGARLRVQGDYYFYLSREAIRDRMKRWLTRDLELQRAKRFTTLLYYLAYYPIFWCAETWHGFHPIHAAGAVTDAGAIVLAGPSGVGKSTLAIALAASGARLLSETFLLQRGDTARPVREPILLDAWSRTWLGDGMRHCEPLRGGFVFERDGFHYLDQLADEARVALIVLPIRAPHPHVRALTAEEAHQRISAANQLVKDLRRYWAFAAALEPLAPSGLMARRETALRVFTESARCVELGIHANMSRDEAARTMLELVDAQPAARALRA